MADDLPERARVALTHVPGRHCASTALCDLARFHGLPYDEAFCFGLGEGLGFFYGVDPQGSPRRLLHVRSGPFEQTFFRNLGVDPRFDRGADREARHRTLRERLAGGHPSLLRTDLRHLPYYGTKTSFPAHAILAVGYDDVRATFEVYDTERPAALEVPYDAMRAARHAPDGPLAHEGDAYCPASMREPPDLGRRLHAAVVAQARALARTDEPSLGLGAYARLEADLPSFGDDADWVWSARFAYQVVEKRGTGGGGFRTLYAEFLDTAAAQVPDVRARGLGDAMRASAAAFTAFAMAMKAASERASPDFGDAAQALGRVREREAEYISLALSLAPP